MSKIGDYFKNDEYLVFFGHDMPEQGYKYIEDYDEDVSREFFIALFKLFISRKTNDPDEDQGTFAGVNFCFDDEFGCYDEDENYSEFIKSLEEEDFSLTKKEIILLKKYLTNLIDDVTSFEEEEYDPDYANSDIKDAIENKSFVIVLSTHSLLQYSP